MVNEIVKTAKGFGIRILEVYASAQERDARYKELETEMDKEED